MTYPPRLDPNQHHQPFSAAAAAFHPLGRPTGSSFAQPPHLFRPLPQDQQDQQQQPQQQQQQQQPQQHPQQQQQQLMSYPPYQYVQQPHPSHSSHPSHPHPSQSSHLLQQRPYSQLPPLDYGPTYSGAEATHPGIDMNINTSNNNSNNSAGHSANTAAHRSQGGYTSQEGPTRSHRRGISSEHGYSVRFNPSRNHGAEQVLAAEQSTFLPRPRAPGLPCIACQMAKQYCDGGSPCRPCQQNRVRCHYEGYNNTKFFSIDAMQLQHSQPTSTQEESHGDRRESFHGHDSSLGTTDGRERGHLVDFDPLPPSRSRSRSGSASGTRSGSSPSSGSGPGSGSRSGLGTLTSSMPAIGGDAGEGNQGHASSRDRSAYARVSPIASPPPVHLTDKTLITIPPFQEATSEWDRPMGNKVTLPSIASIGSSLGPSPGSAFGPSLGVGPMSLSPTKTTITTTTTATPLSAHAPLSTASIIGSTASNSGSMRSNTSRSPSTSSSSRSNLSNGTISPPNTAIPRSLSERPITGPRLGQAQPTGPDPSDSATTKRPPIKKSSLTPQQQQAIQNFKDPLYSLSSASIRARKNALEMENIQRASALYPDFLAKIKELTAVSDSMDMTKASLSGTSSSSSSATVTAAVGGSLFSGGDEMGLQNHPMEIDVPNSTSSSESDGSKKNDNNSVISVTNQLARSASLTSNAMTTNTTACTTTTPTTDVCPCLSIVESRLDSMGKSGLLHSLIQQYFTLIHPQFMIIHKNQLLVRFWDQFGPFPEAREIHSFMTQKSGYWSATHKPKKTNSLLLLAMLALVSRHFIDREQFKSTTDDKKRRLEQSLEMVDRGYRTAEHQDRYQQAVVEAQLRELMETDAEGQSIAGDDLLDRGEQYFRWALDLLKTKYEEPSLTAVQALLLLREYAVMAGNHTQAYMYGEAAITMAMELGWHIAPPPPPSSSLSSSSTTSFAQGQEGSMDSNEAEVLDPEEHRHRKTREEEQRICWWHCFMIDRWMSAAYGRPVNIPSQIFDKTCTPFNIKLKKTMTGEDKTQGGQALGPQQGQSQQDQQQGQRQGPLARAAMPTLTADFWLTPSPSETLSKLHDQGQNQGQGQGQDQDQDPSQSSAVEGARNVRAIGSGDGMTVSSPHLPGAQQRTRLFFDQQCRQVLILDDVLQFVSTWSEDLFVSSAQFEKLSKTLDDWHRALPDWQTFPLSGIVSPPKPNNNNNNNNNINSNTDSNTNAGSGQAGDMHRDLLGHAVALKSLANVDEGRDVVQSTLLGISYHTIRILLFRPFLRTNLRHPPCNPTRASAVCAQSANAITALAEYLVNHNDSAIQPCILMRHQFSLVTAAGIQLMNSNLEEEPRLSTPAKINLLKTIRILRDADRTSIRAYDDDDDDGGGGGSGDGVSSPPEGLHQVLEGLFPAQIKQMYGSSST